MKKLLCATHEGNEAEIVEVEAVFVRSLPAFSIVGLPSQAITESRDRVKAALLGIGFNFPPLKITLNLSPSDLKKEGSHFDLAIAISIALQKEPISFEEYFVFGELGLDGKIKSTVILFSLILSLASKRQYTKVIVPKDLASKLSMIPNLEVYALSSLAEAIEFFRHKAKRCNFLHKSTNSIFKNSIMINNKSYIKHEDFKLDFLDVLGQNRAKRAALISAAGFHNILLEGSPGCGKSMILKRLRYILPPMSVDEILQNAAYRSLNKKNSELLTIRAFRNPHHTSTKASIFGGGTSVARLGEVALADGGILFFDELPYFGKQILESLREPLEDKQILVSRVNSKVVYKTKFIFAAALNPCPCGNAFSKIKTCNCTDLDIKRYKAKLSAPLIDRIDIYVQMEESNPDDKSSLSSKQMYEKVIKAFFMQKNRKQKEFNANLEDFRLDEYCKLDEKTNTILMNAVQRYGMSQRAINKTKRVARTIADLESEQNIKKTHLLEALSFRTR